MSYICVDVESDGGLLGEYSMVCFGAVIVDKEGKLDKTFYGKTRPISKYYEPEALAISGFTREEHEQFDDPKEVMEAFARWINENSVDKPILVSDNNGYDASWINYYFLKYGMKNPFGWSSRRIGDLFCGFFKNAQYQWKRHRDKKRFPHNHHPVSDACGNASALVWLVKQGLKLKL
ncbi:MAG: 3'-5' exoribonuclease [Methanobacterium sp.]